MESILSLLAGAAAKATALLALAALVNLSWRTASASTRHFVWTIGVTAALVLPVAAIAIAWLGAPRLAIPLEMPVATVTASIAQPGEPAVASPSFSEAAAMGPVSGGTEESVAITPEVITPSRADVASTRVQPVTAEIELPALAAIVASSLTGDMFTNWRRSVVIVWLLGALVAVLPLLVAIARVRLLARSARPVSDPRWKYLIEATPAISHLASRVRVLESSEPTMPMTWGVARPALLVPAGASAWPEWKCRNILLHELAHVERRDCLTQVVAHLACAVYWFNPLVWVAAHRMRVERELACDDCVISAGAPASDYASNLLEVARSLRAPSFTSQTAIAMARPSQLSGRLLAVLDAHRNRSGVSRPILAATAISASALVVVLASLTTRAAVATAAEAPSLRVPAVTMDGIIAEAPATTAAFLPVPLSIVQAMQAPAVNVATSRSSSFFSPVSRPLPVAPVVLSPALTASCWEDGDKASVSINNNSTRSGSESWHVRYSREGCSLEMRAEGKFRLRADLSDLESISSDGWFRVEEREGRNSKRIEIRSGGSGLEHQYWVNGDRAPYNDDARRWLASTLLAVERRTAFAAKDRVPQLYRSGGARAVLAEIAQMPSAYAKSRYYGEMLDMEGVLDANALNDIVGRVAVDLRSSDYYLSQVLGRLSTQRSANESTWRAFATAAGGMKSDYYKSQLLKKVLNSGRLSDETVAVLLKSASGVESDYYLSDLLKSVASKYAVNDGTASIYASALARIESDYYRMELLKAMQSSESWDGRTAAFVLTSVRGMKSDYYKSQSLISLVSKNRVDNWDAFFDAVRTVGSSHYKRQALNAALQREPLTKPIVAGVLNTAARIDSDHEKSQILATVARSYKLDGDLRAAYEKVADAIDSEHYRGSALVALRRNESR